MTALRAIAIDTENGSGVRHAARFVLSVYETRTAAPFVFEHRQAWGCWDDKHRAAYQAWAAAPWWL